MSGNPDDGTDLAPQSSEPEYPSPKVFFFQAIAIYTSMFLVGLDRSIVATAIPRITDTFDSIKDIGWYGSAYLLPLCSLQLFYGRCYAFYSTKWLFLSSMAIFQVGSAVCGAAPSSLALVLGRAIAGIGSAGIYAGCMVVFMEGLPLHKRPTFVAGLGAVFGLCSVIGPLLGGAFTDTIGWRWCFYLNLPLATIAMGPVFFYTTSRPKPKAESVRHAILRLDPIGTFAFVPAMVCLFARIIVLFVLFGILFTIWIIVEAKMPETATVPPRISTQRSVAFALFYTIMVGGSLITLVYFLPLWFQAIKGVSALKSGIMSIPMIIPQVIGSIGGGLIVKKTGYYKPLMIACAVIASIGSGLITTFDTYTGHAKWIGYQAIMGLGMGLGMQQGAIAVQAVLSFRDAAVGSAMIMLGLTLGGALFLAIGETVFDNRLANLLKDIPGVDAQRIIDGGATKIRSEITDKAQLHSILVAYNEAIHAAFIVVVAVACCAIIGAVGVEKKNIKPKEPQGHDKSDPGSSTPTDVGESKNEHAEV